MSYIDSTELYLFREGTNCRAYKMLGAHRTADPYNDGNDAGSVRFAVFAPHAVSVSVVGSFNDWNASADIMMQIDSSGVWQCFIGHAKQGDFYKYAITTSSGEVIFKADPYAVRAQLRPDTASVVWEVEEFSWQDDEFIAGRKAMNPYSSPMSIYEVHAGSWKAGKGLYALADELVSYVREMGYTHIELMPVSEFPLDDSWGYQITGFFAVSARYGTPYDLKYFVNACHKAGIGVILDWVGAHYARDAHGLYRFDGEPLYEHKDKRRGEQGEWGTQLFNYEVPEVRSFLISNAVFFLSEFHIDGLRADAVSCMLYHDYGKKPGEWLPNKHGGNENLAAIDFLRQLSRTVGRFAEGALLIAEESTAFPLVTRPPEVGGLGFNFKWNMGYMNDTLFYMSLDPLARKYNHEKLTFSMHYAFSENYILPFSHDEVVHGKRSLIGRMTGSIDEQFAQMRLLFAYQYAHPGKKLMFMGCEFGQFIEWSFRQSLDFCLLEFERHRQLKHFVKRLNNVYCMNSPLFAHDYDWGGFTWLAVDDRDSSVLAFMRKDGESAIICAYNFTPVPRPAYEISVDSPIKAIEMLNTDSTEFGGTGMHHNGIVISENGVMRLRLPPLSAVWLKVV